MDWISGNRTGTPPWDGEGKPNGNPHGETAARSAAPRKIDFGGSRGAPEIIENPGGNSTGSEIYFSVGPSVERSRIPF